MALDEATAYVRKHAPHAFLVSHSDDVLLEEYADGYDSERAHALYSGTKSFWGTAAVYAACDGIIDLDEPVRNGYTMRMLLSMTAGYGFGGLGSAVPAYEIALQIPLKAEPGTRFTYSGIPLQVFGEAFARALQPNGETPHDYLRRRVLTPAGVDIASWRSLRDGTHPLPTGASTTARSWLAYGRYMLAHHEFYADALRGTAANPRYGLCWWLAPPGLTPELFYASGSGGQALYVIPSRELVVVHFSKSTSYKHEAFLKRLLS